MDIANITQCPLLLAAGPKVKIDELHRRGSSKTENTMAYDLLYYRAEQIAHRLMNTRSLYETSRASRRSFARPLTSF